MAFVPVKDYAEWRMADASTPNVPRTQVDKTYCQASVPR